MITAEQAKLYKEQLHPAYAGYLHDGEISEKDILASIFHLIKTGVITPIFAENNMNKEIVSLRKMNRSPVYNFEKEIIQLIFGSKKEISTRELKQYIDNDEIKNIIQKNIQSISLFPMINKKLRFFEGKNEVRFSQNEQPVTTIEDAEKFEKGLKWFFIPLFTVIGVFFLAMSFIPWEKIPQIDTSAIQVTSVSNNADSPLIKLVFGLSFILVPLFMYISFKHSTKVFEYRFDNDIVPYARDRYDEFFEFLKNYPMSNHNFNNEFLAYSIAFGIDRSWRKDFGLDNELDIDESTFGKTL